MESSNSITVAQLVLPTEACGDVGVLSESNKRINHEAVLVGWYSWIQFQLTYSGRSLSLNRASVLQLSISPQSHLLDQAMACMIVKSSSKSVKPSQEPQLTVGYATHTSLWAISLVHEL